MTSILDEIESLASRSSVEAEFAAIEELMQAPSSARGSKRSSGSGRKSRTRKPTKAPKPRHLTDEIEPVVPVVRFHCGGLLPETRAFYRSHPGLMRVHLEQAATALKTGLLPSTLTPSRGRSLSTEIYGLSEEAVALFRARPRIAGDSLNFIARQSLGEVAREVEL